MAAENKKFPAAQQAHERDADAHAAPWSGGPGKPWPRS